MIFHSANKRGHANHGWLNSHHSFSFASFYDPDKMGFGLLRVLNDDVVAPGAGFGEHPHDNMEIISIPLEGSLKHRDSTGREKAIVQGEVQIMSAGTGLYHSEFNASKEEEVNFLQIWILPNLQNVMPRYDQKLFDLDKKDVWHDVVHPLKKESLYIHQDARLALADVNKGLKLELKSDWPEKNGLYLFVLEGEVELAGQNLSKRDALGLEKGDSSANLEAQAESKLLLIDVPLG